MRTTLDLADHLLSQAKQLAAKRRTTLTAVMEDSLRMYLAAVPARPDEGKARGLPLAEGCKPLPGVNLEDTSALWETP